MPRPAQRVSDLAGRLQRPPQRRLRITLRVRSANASIASARPGSATVALLRPAPGCRDRPNANTAGPVPPANSRKPAWIVVRATLGISRRGSQRSHPATTQLSRLERQHQPPLPFIKKTSHNREPASSPLSINHTHIPRDHHIRSRYLHATP